MHVGVIGGGFAGRMAAVRLRSAGLPVTLVDARPDWVERTRLHQAAAQGRQVVRPHRALTDRIGAAFVQGRVIGVETGRIVLDGGDLRPDQIVVAAGSVPDASVDGVDEYALTLKDARSARQIHCRLAALRRGSCVVVVGAGLTGLELATEVASAWPQLDVHLLGDPSVGLSAAGSRVVARALDRLGIRSSQARVHQACPAGLETDAGWLPSALSLWAAGMRAPDWLQGAGLPLDGQGRVKVDPTLRVVGRSGVVAAGDCAGTPLRMACATAIPLGCHAADTVIREAQGKDPRPMSFGFVLRCISLGRGRGLVQLTRHDDQPRQAFGGTAAAAVKEAILGLAAHAAPFEARVAPGAYRWPTSRPVLAAAS